MGDEPLATRASWNPQTRPLYFTHHPNWRPPGVEVVANGLVFVALPMGTPLPPMVLPRARLDGEEDPRVPKDQLTRNLIGNFHFMVGFSLARTDWPRAREEFVEAEAAAPESATLFFNIGQVFALRGFYDEAIAAFEHTYELQPRALLAAGAPRAADEIAKWSAERDRIGALELELEKSTTAMPAHGTPDYHRRMSELLSLRGEELAARGHKLRALEADAGTS